MIGAIAGGGKGAAIGAIAGGVAGAGAQVLTKGEKAGGIRPDVPFEFTAACERIRRPGRAIGARSRTRGFAFRDSTRNQNKNFKLNCTIRGDPAPRMRPKLGLVSTAFGLLKFT